MPINAARIVIWNRNKVVVALASTVWGTSIVFHLLSKSLPPHLFCRRPRIPYKCGLVIDITQVND